MTWVSVQQTIYVASGSYDGLMAHTDVGQANEGEESGPVCSELQMGSSWHLEGSFGGGKEALTVEA